jgi:hypothetical protein
MERLEHPGKGESGHEEHGGDDQSPAARRPTPQQWPQTKEREEDRKDDSEGPI